MDGSMSRFLDDVHDVPLGPAPRNIQKGCEVPHNEDRPICIAGKHPAIALFDFVASPIKVDHGPCEIRTHAPARGEQTAEGVKVLQADAVV
jgi:hypothetical protein